MVAIRVLVTMPDADEVVESAQIATMTLHERRTQLAPHLMGLPATFKIDPNYAPVAVHSESAAQLIMAVPRPQVAGGHSYVVRGTIDHDDLAAATQFVDADGKSRVFSDPEIAVVQTCIGSPPLGNSVDVGRMLGIGRLAGLGMDGSGVAIAIVDNGINLPFLQARGLRPKLDVHASWSPATTISPGAAPIDHGSMCAYDALISAPNATLLDMAVLRSTRPGGSVMAGVLSDALVAYGKLLQLASLPPEERPYHSLVVSNSWGVYDPAWDFPPGTPGRYIDDPAHPFHTAIANLIRAGGDVLFAAGNCGPACPDGRCAFPAGTASIVGANAYPDVITVAGVDTQQNLVGYSSEGPGSIFNNKPDLASYTHFLGSEAFGTGRPDSGTSAACPVLAGVVAALRSKFPFDGANPRRSAASVKSFLMTNAAKRPANGFSFQLGAGIIDTTAFANAGATL